MYGKRANDTYTDVTILALMDDIVPSLFVM